MNTVGGFKESIHEYQGIRGMHTQERIIPGSEKITKIKLSQYASKKFAVQVKDDGRAAAWFLVGDAAMGMPFYRSINSGLMQGSQLARILAKNSLPLFLKKGIYNALRPVKLAREFGAVAMKLSGIRTYKNIIRPCLRGLAAVGLVAVAIPAIALLAAYSTINPKARMM